VIDISLFIQTNISLVYVCKSVLTIRVFNRSECSGRHDFQAKNLDVSVQNLEVMQ